VDAVVRVIGQFPVAEQVVFEPAHAEFRVMMCLASV
jgi:hypothetical protein